ncbi:hypothetical protein SAMN02799636_05979 [Methylobacterium sp. 275MFSha3.1]|nr:hypothetical protein SAMN02799636_05979 [Methylobacterium sp. 275MFSha3.1]
MRGEDVCFEALMPESGPAGNHPNRSYGYRPTAAVRTPISTPRKQTPSPQIRAVSFHASAVSERSDGRTAGPHRAERDHLQPASCLGQLRGQGQVVRDVHPSWRTTSQVLCDSAAKGPMLRLTGKKGSKAEISAAHGVGAQPRSTPSLIAFATRSPVGSSVGTVGLSVIGCQVPHRPNLGGADRWAADEFVTEQQRHRFQRVMNCSVASSHGHSLPRGCCADGVGECGPILH